jgi:hypothetical protein
MFSLLKLAPSLDVMKIACELLVFGIGIDAVLESSLLEVDM